MDPITERIASLPPAKRALLELQLRMSKPPAPAGPPLVRQGGSGSLPLSFAQQRLWFLYGLDPLSPLYNIPQAFRLRGPLRAGALRRALGAVVARHEVLRTRFWAEDGTPRQAVLPPRPVDLPVLDLAGLPAPARERESLAALRRAARLPFDLPAGELLRAALVRLEAEEHLLLVTVHHVASDGWSTQVLAREISAAYAAALSGDPPTLPGLPVQYADYALWQREWLQGEALERPLAWWRERLAGVQVLDLPTDRPRPPVQSFRGGGHPFRLPAPLQDSVRALAGGMRATPFMVLLAAFDALLHRYTGEDDLLVGSPVAGRSRSETDGLIGFFVNTLPLRVDLSGDPTFRELVERARGAALGAYAHQEVPFEKLVEELRPERNPSRGPLVQVMLALQNLPRHPLDLPGVEAEAVEVDTGTAKFDLTLFLYEEDDGLRGRLEYAADLFEPATAGRFVERLHGLLEAALDEPELRLSGLPLLDPAERRRVLEEPNRTARPYPRDASVAALFEARAAVDPDAVALVHGPERTTYAELDARADRLAHLLAAAGTGPGDRVGVLMERSPAMVAAMLAALKAGAAYVPLDPAHPPERIRSVAEDAGIRVLLTDGAPPPPGLPAAVRVLDLRRASPERTPPGPPGRRTPPDAAAYVVYTSGSTGAPKGVVVPHRAVVRLVLGTDYAQLAPGDAVAHLSNPAFDAATWEVWGALLTGARLVVLDRDALAPARLRDALREQAVSALFLTTALFNAVAQEAPDAFAPLRHLLFGGEAADPHAVRRVLRAGPPERLLHVYGPTETTTFATWHRVEEVPEGAVSVPIGRPIANARTYVLDPHGSPLPEGLPGELYVGGDGLAHGYGGRPELTAERFVPDPFSGRPGARMYRTGDRVRLRGDGALEFLGRGDRQVKIRGFRIEPGETEAVLAGCPGVAEAAVVVREDAPGERRLVAYVAPAALDAEELRRRLRERLPEYMVPSAVVPLPALPLTPNGKVDRRALPAPGPAAAAGGSPAPRDALEHRVAAIWEEVLGVRGVGIRDDFFALGGHSLLAVRMMSRVEATFGRAVPLAVLFGDATVEGLAAALRREWPAGEADPAVVLNGGGSRPPLFFLHGDVGGGGLYGLPLARRLGADQPLVLLPPLRLELERSHVGIREMARRHLEILRGIRPEGPYRLGGYCNGGLVAYEMARLLEQAGERVELLLLVQASAESAYLRVPLRAVELFGRAAGWTGEERLERLARARDHLRDLHREIREHAARGAAGLGALCRAKLGRLARRMARGSAGREGGAAPASRSGEPGVRALRVRGMYRAMRAYLPGRYPGRVTVLWTHGTDPVAWDPSVGWRRVAAEVDVVTIPGTHDSCVAAELDGLADRIAACLRRLDQGGDGG